MAGAAGHFVTVKENPEEHAIALVLGRLFMHTLSHNMPDLFAAGMLSLHYLVGAVRLRRVQFGGQGLAEGGGGAHRAHCNYRASLE